ncbi:hypothetical protein LTR78_007491 [Recurvomyces mirabilis]|uniref:Uncharacterized protein n=1 Tax=Recurvomyces mirabilis TaxID=574656 RepID=A0AAE0WI57_9PEZI|nr:hypothetical protein LTR78_007491 [Recurvomyces mirabilis]KAK5159999.1 hypothetical protein LTS14_002105 [Recurvomyces mirabilis]
MADNDGDSRMASSPELTDTEEVETPLDQITNSSILSPPDSQHREPSSNMPTSAPGVARANANGKRPLNTISNGEHEVIDVDAPMNTTTTTASANANAGKARAGQEFATHTHQASGYSWNRAEDEPGYAWLNKKAMDERSRAWADMVHQDCVVGNRYGDPFEMAEREQAMLNSLKQR